MRHRVVVITTVLATTGLAVAAAGGCSRAKDDRPAPQAQPPVASASAPVGGPTSGPTTTPGPAGGTTQDSAGGTTKTGNTGPTDPAGAVKGHPQTLPTGTDINAVGIGPYSIGQEAATLTTAKLIGPVKAGAAGCDSATGLAKWGSPTLFLAKGKLQHVKITSATVRTTSGIKVGSSEASVKTAYANGSVTSGRAWYVPTGDFALLFRLAGGKVTAVEAGPASILQTGAAAC